VPYGLHLMTTNQLTYVVCGLVLRRTTSPPPKLELYLCCHRNLRWWLQSEVFYKNSWNNLWKQRPTLTMVAYSSQTLITNSQRTDWQATGNVATAVPSGAIWWMQMSRNNRWVYGTMSNIPHFPSPSCSSISITILHNVTRTTSLTYPPLAAVA